MPQQCLAHSPATSISRDLRCPEGLVF